MKRKNYTEHTCPDRNTHTTCPREFNAWFDWAEKMEATHEQTKCQTCGLWAIWVLKPEGENGRGE